MPEPLKNLYSTAFINRLAITLEKCILNFDSKKFIQIVLDKEWSSKELKQRMGHISYVLHQNLSGNYIKDVKTILKINTQVQKENYPNSFVFMFLPDYIEKYGLEHFELSMRAMEQITQFISCEFAIRPFLTKYPEQTLQQMTTWSKHPHHHVRRFASEGTRPLLPWGLAVSYLKTNPTSGLQILENLKNDSSEFVRKSVANHLNDISKLDAQCVITVAKKWKGKNKEADAIIKHACRTLLKKGNEQILSLYNLSANKLQIKDFYVTTPKVKIGNYCEFIFELSNKSKQATNVRIEYAVYYLLKNGNHFKKVFKISEKELPANSSITIERKQSFKLITTRVYYKGLHKLGIIINGKEFEVKEFILS